MQFDDLLRKAERALVDLDTEALVSLYAPEFLFEDTASGDRITDKEELKVYFNELFSLPDVAFVDVNFYALGERGAGRWTWCGSSIQSGKEYAIRGASLFKLGEDGIREEIIFYDPRSAID
ncbi:MAG: hypothetical protein GTO18_18960 [Anaerolineales bacterium]|nr:hypothetical protein [Anaerolineales bacterium]